MGIPQVGKSEPTPIPTNTTPVSTRCAHGLHTTRGLSPRQHHVHVNWRDTAVCEVFRAHLGHWGRIHKVCVLVCASPPSFVQAHPPAVRYILTRSDGGTQQRGGKGLDSLMLRYVQEGIYSKLWLTKLTKLKGDTVWHPVTPPTLICGPPSSARIRTFVCAPHSPLHALVYPPLSLARYLPHSCLHPLAPACVCTHPHLLPPVPILACTSPRSCLHFRSCPPVCSCPHVCPHRCCLCTPWSHALLSLSVLIAACACLGLFVFACTRLWLFLRPCLGLPVVLLISIETLV